MDEKVEQALAALFGAPLVENISKMGPGEGGDMHVPTSISAPKGSKAKYKLRAKPMMINSVEKAAEPKGPSQREAKIGSTLTGMGAVGGVASLPGLAAHSTGKLRQAGVMKPKVPSEHIANGVADKIGAHLKPIALKVPGMGVEGKGLRDPKVGAGLAIGAAGLEVAGLGGDFVAHHALKQQGKVAKSDQITFSKVDSDKRQVFGWCSLSKKDGQDVVDLQGDIIPIEEIEKSAYDYVLTSRKGGNQHEREGEGPRHVGNVIESMVFTPEKIEKMGLPGDFPQGWWIGMKIEDEETWQQVKSGERAGFSVHGAGRRAPVEKAYKVDRKEQVKDIALGTAGAVAAGSGAGAGLLGHAKFVRKVGMDTTKAATASGRLKVVGATVGGAAGVYGGLHAIHVAAKVPPTKVKKAWSPTVDRPPMDAQRQKRAQVYETGAKGATGGLVALSGLHAGIAGHAHRAAKANAALAASLNVSDAELKRRVNVSRGLHYSHDSRRAKAGRVGLNAELLNAKQAKSEAKIRTRVRAARVESKKFQAMSNTAKTTAVRHAKLSGRSAVIAGVTGAAAAGIHHARQESWK